jgi:hypothetical protein
MDALSKHTFHSDLRAPDLPSSVLQLEIPTQQLLRLSVWVLCRTSRHQEVGNLPVNSGAIAYDLVALLLGKSTALV